MTFGTERRNSFSDRLPPNALPQPVLGGVALAFVATLCAWTVCGFADTGADQTVAATRGDRLDVAVNFGDRFARASSRGDKLAVLKPSAPLSNVYASLFDSRFSLDRPSGFANDAPQQPDGDLVALAP
jgi:hypothetical protein